MLLLKKKKQTKKRVDSDILKVKKIIVVRGVSCIILRKDTVRPLSHQMMDSWNCFNFKQVFAPSEKKKSTRLKSLF